MTLLNIGSNHLQVGDMVRLSRWDISYEIVGFTANDGAILMDGEDEEWTCPLTATYDHWQIEVEDEPAPLTVTIEYEMRLARTGESYLDPCGKVWVAPFDFKIIHVPVLVGKATS